MPAKKTKKKLGPFTWVGWAGVGGGVFAAYFLYRWYRGRQVLNAAATQSALTGGTTIPTGQAAGTSQATGLPSFSDFGAWEQAAIAAMAGSGLNAADALNGITLWINGNCVNAAQYKGLSGVITQVGLPPGFGSSLPSLSVCPSQDNTKPPPTQPPPIPPVQGQPYGPPGPPPNLPQAIAAAMTSNGESLIGSPVWDQKLNEWIFATNKGGVYDIGANGQPGTTFYGSYLGLPSSDRQGEPAGGRVFTGIRVNPDGSYTLTDTKGETYTFQPGTPQAA